MMQSICPLLYKNMNILIWVLAALLLVELRGYEEKDGVIILTGADLPKLTQISPHLFVLYFVPWCKHCLKLEPIFTQIAQELKDQNSPIRLAKIDCEEHSQAYDFADLHQFPTLHYYNKGEQLDFDGERTKSFLLKWLTKRIKSPITEISLETLQQFRKNSSEVALVYHGQLNGKAANFINLAYQDNYNNYYQIKQSDSPEGEIELLRNFDEDIRISQAGDDFQSWVLENDRPVVVPLDDRSISAVFRDEQLGAFLILQEEDRNKESIFMEAAQKWRSKQGLNNLIFISLPEEHEDFYGLLEYMNINPIVNPVVIVNIKEEKKYVFAVTSKQFTIGSLIQFLQDYSTGKIEQSPLQSIDHHHHHDHEHDHDHGHHHDHDHHHHHHHHAHSHQSDSHDESDHGHVHTADCGHHHHSPHKEEQQNHSHNEQQQAQTQKCQKCGTNSPLRSKPSTAQDLQRNAEKQQKTNSQSKTEAQREL